MNKFDTLFNIISEEYFSNEQSGLRNFEFCLQLKEDMKTFTTVKV